MSPALNRWNTCWKNSTCPSTISGFKPLPNAWKNSTAPPAASVTFAEAFPEIKEEGQPHLDFMKDFRPGHKKENHEGDEKIERGKQQRIFPDNNLSGNFA
jgi:hypothetical protein